ncbi:PhzF family phenazine biosynthesis protein [Uliginosibacterium gangwonense]|uniref:PhzF family phenazine biosynthesis protein n=1 Tax=Uliginosibacterium gangwonense TaxID=392736 RepID=UPI000368F636|nr:PhzF family phenazine biosynthesis protein [Uliginosibacterium gangwonense]
MQQYVVDAFTSKLFAGNPAAVCPLDAWLDDALLQAIAMENNLSETAFFVPEGECFHLRWFTPAAEVKLCGHATLASAHVLFTHMGYEGKQITFHTLSGALCVERTAKATYRLTLPAHHARPSAAIPAELVAALGVQPLALLETDVYLAVLADEATVRHLSPDISRIAQLPCRAVIVTAAGDKVDFVSRFFAPKMGVPEDPVTGSAHCVLTPYWGQRLGKQSLLARQLSARGGELRCEWNDTSVCLEGQAVTFMAGQLML